MNATPRLTGAVRPYPRRNLGALLAVALFAIGLFSMAQTPAAHAATSGATIAKPHTALRTAHRADNLSAAAARRAAARRAATSGRPTAHAAALAPPVFIPEWWGLRVVVDRDVACFLAADHPAGYAALGLIPPP